MPTNTFYNLSKEKKERLLWAAKKEFERVPFNEVSINKIIQSADISRGSFYTYFKDKIDLAICMMDEYLNMIINDARQSLLRSGGDVFQMFIDIFDLTLDYGNAKNDILLMKNIFHSIKTSTTDPDIIFKSRKEPYSFLALIALIDPSNLNTKDAEDLHMIVEILASVTMKSIFPALENMANKQIARVRFLKKIEMLKTGILKT